jgi:hypothetical protein
VFGDVWRCLEARFNAPSGLVISTDPRRVPDLGRGKTALKKYILGVSHRDRTDQNRHELTPIWKAFSVLHSKNMQKPLHLRSQTFASQNGVVTVAPVRCQTATRNGVSMFSIIFHHFPQTATNLIDLSAWAGNMWSSGSTQQCLIQMSFPDGFVVIYYTILWPYYTILKKTVFARRHIKSYLFTFCWLHVPAPCSHDGSTLPIVTWTELCGMGDIMMSNSMSTDSIQMYSVLSIDRYW